MEKGGGDVEALKMAAEATGMALLCIVMVAAAIRLLRPPPLRRRFRAVRQGARPWQERVPLGPSGRLVGSVVRLPVPCGLAFHHDAAVPLRIGIPAAPRQS